MGNCLSNSDSSVSPKSQVITSERRKKAGDRTTKSLINMSDLMGIRQSDSIDDTYDV